MTASPGGRTVFWQLFVLGSAIALLSCLTPMAFRTWGDNAYMTLTIPAGILTLVATRVAERSSSPRVLWLIFLLALGLRGFVLSIEPILSTDIYRYIWDGRVQAEGINPYRFVPKAPELEALRDITIFPHINRADYAVTIYPPVAQAFFFVVTRLGETVTTMRLALLACEAVTVVMIWRMLRLTGRPVTRIVAYVWHPLPLWEIANSGHVDALMVALMMTGLWLVMRGKTLRGVAAVSLAALAKPFALLALPAIWRPWDWRAPVLAIAVAAACYVPYSVAGASVLGFLPGYLREEGVDDGGENWLLGIWRLVFGVRQPLDSLVYLVLAGVILGGLALRAAFRSTRTPQTILADVGRLLLIFLLLLSPKYPWYFLAITPFVALRGGATLWAATLGALLLQEEVDIGVYTPLLVRKSGLYGAVAVAWLWAAWMKSRNGSAKGGAGIDFDR